MLIKIKEILGLADIPAHRTSASEWLAARSIAVQAGQSKGGKAHFVSVSDLPEAVRLAYWRREVAELHLDPGTFDDAAHAAFLEAPAKARARAERRALIAAMLTALRAQGVKEGERLALVQEKFGAKGTSPASLKRLQRAVEEVDPIN